MFNMVFRRGSMFLDLFNTCGLFHLFHSSNYRISNVECLKILGTAQEVVEYSSYLLPP